MADITDPRVVSYETFQIRPMCHKLRALKAEIDAAMTTWYGSVSALCPNDTSKVVDKREAEGINQLTGINLVNVVNQMAEIQTLLDKTGVAEIISFPCVQPLKVAD
jgi:hypothetical protein